MADLTKDGQGSVTDPNLTDEEKLAAIEKAKGLEDAAAGDAGAGEGAGAGKTVDEDEAAAVRLSEFMRKKGINDITKLVDLAENLEKRNTQLDQDVRRLSASGRFPVAGEGVIQPQAGGAGRVVTVDDGIDFDVPENPLELFTDPKKLKEFGKKLILAGRDLARNEVQAEKYEAAKQRVQAKMAENPQEFARLRPIMLELSRGNPDADIDQLYSAAKNIYTEDRKGLVSEVKAELGLADPGADSRLKGIIGRVRQAPVGGGTGVQVTVAGDEASRKKNDAQFLKAIMDSDKY